MSENTFTDFEELLKENLFGEWNTVFLDIIKDFDDPAMPSILWNTAKRHTLDFPVNQQYVTIFKKRCLDICREVGTTLNARHDEIGKIGISLFSDIAISCFYTMVIVSVDESWAKAFAKYAQFLPNRPAGAGRIYYQTEIKRHVAGIVDKIMSHQLAIDYDYIKGCSTGEKAQEESQAAAAPSAIEQLQDKIAACREEIASLKALVEKQKEQLDFYQQAPAVPQPHAKPRLALLLKLMERSGADIEKHGAKSKAARLAEYLTGLSIQTCKNFMSDPHLDTSTHAREIADCNELLRQLDLDCQL